MLKIGDKVKKNPETWIESDFDSWAQEWGLAKSWNHQKVKELIKAEDGI